MPELPDVQVFKEYLDATSLHQTIVDVHLADAEEILDGVSGRTLRRHLKNNLFRSTRRRGKHLFVGLDAGGWLHLHFGMTGSLRYFKSASTEVPEYAKLRTEFGNGFQLAYLNPRKLGALGLVEDVDGWIEEAGLGPDALGLDRGELGRILDGRRGTIKSALMNQDLLAGLGNIYTDEILFHAGIHPRAEAGALGFDQVKALHKALVSVLHRAIEGRVQSFPRSFLIRRREEGANCPRCDGHIRKTTVSGRPTYYCDGHQGAGD